MKRFLLVLLPVLLAFRCGPGSIETYHYFDGSGNGFVISQGGIKYDPVSAIHSSSGTYSGGNAYEGSISSEDLARVKELFQRAFDNEDIHIESRVKGSGFLEVRHRGEARQVILQPGSPEQLEIEEFLVGLISR